MDWRLMVKAIEKAKKNGLAITDKSDLTVGDWSKMTEKQRQEYEPKTKSDGNR